MRITASKLREDIYNILDRALERGEPIEVFRKGRVLRIVPEKRVPRLSRLKKRNALVGDPRSIVHMDWVKEWNKLK